MEFKNLLVTGGLGFIGSNYVNYISKEYPDINVTVLDINDYCASEDNIIKTNKIKIINGDIANNDFVTHILYEYSIDSVIHFAAQSHVDNSFFNSVSFTLHNVLGTHKFIEAVRIYNNATGNLKKFLHISTDEVYGDVTDDSARTENCTLDPTNPYAATKAAAELMVKSYYYSYNFPVVISRCNNVYGKNQYPEKLIPLCICNLQNNKKMTVQGTGKAIRNYIHTDDVVKALNIIFTKGELGEIYNIRGDHEYTVLEIMRMIAKIHNPNINPDTFIEYGPDRCFNDTRYHINGDKLYTLGWKQEVHDFESQLKDLYVWYYENKSRYGF
jgi:dTDP-glucose 4,6-dehydratase